MLPISTTSTYDRRRPGQSRKRPLVRSNSSLLGSIKNFVAAPFARLFTGTANDFEDPNNFSGKRRIVLNQEIDNNDIVEDGPAPAKRMRVKSPSPPRSAGYLDPPGSAFRLNNNNNNLSTLPSRSASISLPSTTLPDYNARSTISPLRNQFSRNMSIDSIPSYQPRPLTRDITMKSLSSIPADIVMSGSRDSLPPLAGRPFRLRESLTPQPHSSIARQPHREVSEPPPVTALNSNPVFVRGPSQTSEPQTQPAVVPTLGSLVDSQRIVRSPSRQRTLLFGSSQPPADPQAIAAERALHELEFYKTPLVPTRIRSRMPNALATSTSSSNITDMFSRRHSLILMGDHDRPSKRDKKAKGKKGKETNETKPYAGTTGIKKRLAKAKGVNEEAQTDAAPDQAVTVEAKTKVPASPKQTAVPKVPVPPPEGKDTFSVAAFPSGGTSAQQSSLRVGRAPRSHLSRPNKKFSAAYDEEDDKATDETQRELEMLEEAAKKVPVFEIPAGFSFAKDAQPVEPVSITAKEPPITVLPFSLSTPVVPAPVPSAQSAPVEVQPIGSALFGPPSGSSLSGASTSGFSQRNEGQVVTSRTTEVTETDRVPDFFASSKVLASQPSTPVPPSLIRGSSPRSLSSTPVPPAPVVNSAFSFAPISAKESAVLGGKKDAPSTLFSSPMTSGAGGLGASQTSIIPLATPPLGSSQKDDAPSLSFGGPASQPSAAAPQPSSFSFNKTPENDQPKTTFLFGSSATAGPNTSAESAPKPNPFSFGSASSGSAPTKSLFGNSSESVKPDSSSLFGASNGSVKPPLFGSSIEGTKSQGSSLFGASNESTKHTSSSLFSFSQPSVGSNTGSSTMTAKSLFGPQSNVAETPKQAFGNGNGSLNSPFSFAPPASGAPEPPKSLFGAPSNSNQSSSFRFGSSSAPSTSAGATGSSFSFGTGNSNSNSGSSFSFGSGRPITPPPSQDQEVRMEESPTRDIKPLEQRPSLAGFAFNSAPLTSTGTSFGQSSATPSLAPSFSFGSSPSVSNPFDGDMTDDKPAENKPFGMGQPQASSFSFGRTPENDPPRPSTTGSFSFSNSSASNTGPGPTFSFGAPSNNTAPQNPFGGQNSSNPNSPLTFGQPSPFSNPASGAGASTSFMFGSQPASPATPNVGLPPSGFGSSNGFGAPAPSNSGFGAPPSSGGSLFTIGAAPTDSGRQIKKMPTRKKR